MIRNIIIVILIILLAFAIWKFNVDKRKATEGSNFNRLESELYDTSDYGNFQDDWNRFEDNKAGYHIKYPGEWMIESRLENDEMIRADIAYNQRAGFQIRKLIYDAENFSSFVDAYLTKFKDEMSTHWKGNFSDEQKTIDNRLDSNFSRTSYKFITGDNVKWLFIEYIWQKDDVVITFQCGLEYELIEELQPVFDKIADSFEWILEEK